MKNSPSTYQCLVNTIISGLDGCDAYIDDLIIHNKTFEDHLQSIRNLFDRLSDANLTINLNFTINIFKWYRIHNINRIS